MRRVRGLFVAIVVMMLTTVGFGGSSQAAVPTGYSVDDGVVVTVTGATLIGGEVVNVKVAASRTVDGVRVPVTCNVLRVSITPDLVESYVGGGASTFDLSLDTQVVSKRTPTVITATCEYTPFGAGGGTASAANIITLLPLERDGGAATGILPRTGTEVGLWLVAVGALLVAGGGVLVARRPRA